jgi:hypothetical protein
MKTTRLTALVLALGLAGGAALAQTVVTDTDGNGTYSIEELKAAYPDLTDAQFKALDVDGNGQIDADELQAGREAGTIAP